MRGPFIKIGTLPNVAAFRQALQNLGAEIPCDGEVQDRASSPLAWPATVFRRTLGNRFAAQPMEGWDGTPDGRPTEHTFRRWKRFGESGAKLIWGGEAVAVRHDGRANPRQLLLTPRTAAEIARLRETLVQSHKACFGTADDLLVGIQLTHSGRYARPNSFDRPEPRILYHHPLLDRRMGLGDDYPVLTDGDVRAIIESFVQAAMLAWKCGFDFVDIKHCHGYLGHEFLSAKTRPGAYGGSLRNRTRFLAEVVEGIRSHAPTLGIAVRLSAFDTVPFHPDPERSKPGRPGPGIPDDYCDAMPYEYGFGVDAERPTDIDLAEPAELMGLFQELGISLVNITGGCPYTNPHIQRPALYPPSDAYLPPEDPIIGVARHLTVTAMLKAAAPNITFVGTGYTYLQEFLPNVAQAAVREGWTDFVGLGRMLLAYPELPGDLLERGAINHKRLCRTFSDCTTAPRHGLISGCYPLDPYYKESSEAQRLARIKASERTAGNGTTS
ncbi:MAG: NADH:flavin oxidoreductase [Chthonomonadales bacterium]